MQSGDIDRALFNLSSANRSSRMSATLVGACPAVSALISTDHARALGSVFTNEPTEPWCRDTSSKIKVEVDEVLLLQRCRSFVAVPCTARNSPPCRRPPRHRRELASERSFGAADPAGSRAGRLVQVAGAGIVRSHQTGTASARLDMAS
eukprot:COSAG01_NODE_7739_length_3077_cov_31.188046_4_plen_149_part_00